GCSSQCVVEGCGNGVVESGEECDDGNTASDDGCSWDCHDERCGDGIVQANGFPYPEECDDGNEISGDGCSSSCVNEWCGDGIVQSELGEACDDGGLLVYCTASCQPQNCGDGNLDPGEDCDDGNLVDCDGCSAKCEDEELPTLTMV